MDRETIEYLEISRIDVEPQVRERLNPRLVEQLAASFRSVGQLQPIRVRVVNGRLVVIDGHHRVAAGHVAPLSELASIVEGKVLCTGDVIQRQLVSNCLREALTPLETARAIERLMQETKWNAAQVGEHVGFSAAKISKLLPLLTLPPEIAAQIESGHIPASAGYELSKVANAEDQAVLAEKIASGQLTRDGMTGARKATKKRSSDQSLARTSRVTAMLAPDRSITICGPALTLDSLIGWLEELLSKARKARPQGLELGTFIRALKDQARG